MNTVAMQKPEQKLQNLCSSVRKLIADHEYNECFHLICQSMESFPDAPEPHNLLGILFEKQGNHPSAMRHFRAAYALDPSYAPASMNLDTYGTFYSKGCSVYGDEDTDCPGSSAGINNHVNIAGRI